MRLPGFIRHGVAALIGGARVRVRSGPNQGRWWSLASAGRGAVAGTFEAQRVDALLRLIGAGDIVWDIGAHKGYVTLAIARRVGPDGRVYAFEPSPVNLRYLRRHVAWNGADNVEIVPAAVGDADGTARFGGSGSSITYRLGQGDDTVVVHRVTTLLAQGLAAPTVLKLDVEGGEGAALRGAGAALRDVDLVLVAVHSRAMYDECRSLLEQMGFAVYRSASMRAMMERLPGSWSADPDLLAVAPARHVDGGALALFSGRSC